MEMNFPSSDRPIYLDHNATTPVDPRVLEAMMPYFTDHYGNAASVDHEYGVVASRAVDKAREQVAGLLGAKPGEIIFTSGATEANNLAILGVAERNVDRGQHIITCVTEHPAVLDPCRHLEEKGWDVTYVPVDQYGLVDPEDVRRAIRPDTVLITIMAANNEIGTIAPIAEIGQLAKAHGVYFHSDATQAVGHIELDVNKYGLDLLSISAHKIYGPKGVGALYIRRATPRVHASPIVHGGGHERGMRSGTLNSPGIVGLGEASSIAHSLLSTEPQRLRKLRDSLFDRLLEAIGQLGLNGHPEKRLPHVLNLYIPGIESRSLLVQVKSDIAVSTGSACTTTSVEPSHVLAAIGRSDSEIHSSIRMSVGRWTSDDDISAASAALASAVKRMSAMIR